MFTEFLFGQKIKPKLSKDNASKSLMKVSTSIPLTNFLMISWAIEAAHITFTYSKPVIETLDKGVKYV